MPQTFSLQPLLDLMQTRTDEATRTLGKLIAAEQSQRSRLQMLEQYREEYAQRLREAIAQQRLAVEDSERNTKAGQAHWQSQNKQLKAIDTLSQRHDARERYRENKIEQKLQDEFSTRKYGTKDPSDPDS